jgi:hypothetical protein
MSQFQTISSWVYLISATLVKLSLLFLYRTLFGATNYTRYAITGAIIVCTLLNFGLLIGIVLFCIPVQKAWNSMLDGHCSDPAVLSYFTGASNVFFDLYVLLVPVPLVWSLQMNKKRKVGVAAVFGIGIL